MPRPSRGPAPKPVGLFASAAVPLDEKALMSQREVVVLLRKHFHDMTESRFRRLKDNKGSPGIPPFPRIAVRLSIKSIYFSRAEVEAWLEDALAAVRLAGDDREAVDVVVTDVPKDEFFHARLSKAAARFATRRDRRDAGLAAEFED